MSNPHSSPSNPVDLEIAGRIKTALIVNNINVRSLSDTTGIAYPTLRRSLAGGRSLSFQEFTKIAGALEVPSSSLLPPSLTGNAA